jgi:ABC-type transport system substrate-binding protein
MAGTVVDAMLSDVAGATAPGIGSGTPVRGGTLNIGLASDAPNAYTFTGATGKLDDAGFNVAIAVFDALFATSANGQTVLPNLGTSVSGSTGPNGAYTLWDVNLRAGVTFHDGSAFDADAVVANFNAALANATVGSAINPLFKSCTKTGTLSVQYETLFPIYNFPHFMSESQIAYMANPLMFASSWAADHKLPNGTGPFKADAWSIGHFSSWVKNPSYWRKDASGAALPYLNEVYFKTIVDPSTRLTALKTNSINIGIFSDGVSIKAIEKGVTSAGKKCEFVSSAAQSIVQPAMNCVMCNVTGKDLSGQYGSQNVNSSGSWKVSSTPSPIADQGIRHALALAIDTKGYLSGIDQNVGAVSNGIFTTTSSFYKNPGYPVYSPSSVAAAKALVAAYKTTNKLSKSDKVTIHMQTVSGSKTSADAFAYVAKDAAAVGITLVAVPLVQSVLIGNAIERTYEMTEWTQFGGVIQDGNYVWWDSSKLSNGTTAPGFHAFEGTVAGGVNFANNIDGTIESAMVSALAATTAAAQKAQWQTVNARFGQFDYPYLWLDETVVVWAAQATVQNWANPMAPTATSPKSTVSTLGPASGVLSWAQIWIS